MNGADQTGRCLRCVPSRMLMSVTDQLTRAISNKKEQYKDEPISRSV